MIRLSDRLRLAESLVPEGATVIDVGSDSGQFVLSLEEKGHHCYAVENKEGPYKILVDNLNANRSKVTPIFQDGLAKVPSDCDCITILGMGGQLIGKILASAFEKIDNIETIIVGPQSDFSAAFLVLRELGFSNTGGAYVFEKHYYPILLFTRGTPDASVEETAYGSYPLKNRDPLLYRLLKNKKKNLQYYLDSGYSNSMYEKDISMIDRALSIYYGEESEK